MSIAAGQPQTERAARRLPAGRQFGNALFWLLALLAALYLLRLGRHTSFFFDEWSWIEYRRGWAPHNFLLNHNGHFSAVPVLVYHLLFATAGLRAYLPYRLVLMATHVLVCYGVYRYARLRVGPLMALLPAGMLLMVGVAYQDLLWPFQMGFLGSLAFGIAALLLLDGQRTRRRDVLACAALVGALACSSVGLPILVAAAVRVVLRAQWRHWWVIVVPAAIYLAWYVEYGRSAAKRGTPAQTLGYFGDSYRAAVGALTGHPARQWHTQALVLGLALLVAVVLAVLVAARRRRVPVALLSVTAAGISLWGLTAITRAQYRDAGASRYLYLDVFLLLLVIVELLREVDFGASLSRRAVAAVLTVAALLSTWTGLTELRRGAEGLAQTDTYVRADLAALEHSQGRHGFRPDPARIPIVNAGLYAAARRALGSPAMRWSQIASQGAALRTQVDRVLLRAGGNLLVVPLPLPPGSPAGPVPVLAAFVNGRSAGSGSCEQLTPTAGQMSLTFTLPVSGATLTPAGAVQVLARRFGPVLLPALTLQSGQGSALRPSSDGSPVGWTIQVVSDSALTLCGS